MLAEAFGRRVRFETSTAAALDDAITNATVIDALLRSERSGRFENVVSASVDGG